MEGEGGCTAAMYAKGVKDRNSQTNTIMSAPCRSDDFSVRNKSKYVRR